jgi:hypothetical protein
MSEQEHGVPQPPAVERRLLFFPEQAIGMPVIILVAVLGLLGIIDQARATQSETGLTLTLDVDYPSRMRYRQDGFLVVEVGNIAADTVPTLTVAFDADYIDQFKEVVFTPSIDEVTPESYLVQFDDVPPGEIRRVVVELRPDSYWRQDGEVAGAPGGSGTPPDIEATISTLVLP